jgi:hypothetical protein
VYTEIRENLSDPRHRLDFDAVSFIELRHAQNHAVRSINTGFAMSCDFSTGLQK